MSDAPVGTVDKLGVNTVELTHALSKVTFRRLHHCMVMIGHLTIRVTAPVEAFAHLAEQIQPGFTVGIVSGAMKLCPTYDTQT